LKNYLKSKKIKKILSLEFLFEEKNRDFESKDYYLSVKELKVYYQDFQKIIEGF
jgi:hypothetical protein